MIPDGYLATRMGGEFIRANGPMYLKKSDGRVWLGFRVEPRHCNPAQILHGGMMASFVDMMLPVCATHLERSLASRFMPTISLQLDYLAPSPLGAWIEGEAQVLRSTPSLVFVQGLVTADGTPVARASGIFKVGPPVEQI